MRTLRWAPLLPAIVVVLFLLARVGSLDPGAAARARVTIYKGGLAFPVDMAWARGTKKIFFTEKNSGRVRVMNGRTLIQRPCVDLPVNSTGERGALGIALDPQFKNNHYLYVYYTNAAPLENRVTRFVVKRNVCTSPRDIVTGLNASSSGYHNGGQLEFAGNKLFVATGEAHDPGEAQSTTNRLGKILRINRNGSVPSGNPFSTGNRPNPVWSYGHRNPFGLAYSPRFRKLYESENGPSCDDEANLIRPGRNYGWGSGYRCGTAGVGRDPQGPLIRWRDIIVPTDLTWYEGRLTNLSGGLYMGDYQTGRLHRLVLNSSGTQVTADRIILDGSEGILDVSPGPDGYLYFLTPTSIKRVESS